MIATAVRAADLPQTTPTAAEGNGEAEYAALLAMLDRLGPDDWARPTDCTQWSVRDLVAHLAGAAEEATRPGVAIRRLVGGFRAQRRLGGLPIEHTCAIQLADRAGLSAAEVETDLRRWVVGAPRGRRRQPPPLRLMRFPAVVGFRAGVRGAYAFDVIYNRDTWLHRVDLSRATGVDLVPSGAEGEIVGQVVKDLDVEWTGPAFRLTLTGVGGGTWQVGDGPVVAELTEDSVAYCRLLSGRSDECAFAVEGDPDVVPLVRSARVVF